VADRKHGSKAPETHSTVTAADWSDTDISGQAHEGVLFVDLDAAESRNTGATFTDCTFRRSRFNCSRHSDAAFVNCTFINCNFFEAHFSECKLVGSMFDRCTYDLMQVTGGNWSHVGLPGADFRKASFTGTRLREADLTGVQCQGAAMRDLDLSGAWLHGAKLSKCDLRGSDLGALEPENVDLRGAIVTYEQALVIAVALGLDVRPE
jgi:fluoroquinolone resistance protein